MYNRYSWQQIILHWVSAALIIWATFTGFYVALFNPAPEHKNWVGFINVSLTTLFIPLFIARIFFALRHPKPDDGLLSDREVTLAAYGHIVLYMNITIVLLTGVLMMDRPIDVFSLFALPQPLHDGSLIRLFNQMHVISCMTLAFFVVGHILAVVKHHHAGKPILRRML